MYLEDTWQATPRLSLRAGLRWSRQDLRADGKTATFRGYRVRDGFQPRVGLVYQPGTIGTQRLFASYSRAAEQLPIWGFQDFSPGAESLFVLADDPRLAPSTGEIVYTYDTGVGTPADRELHGQGIATWRAGYSRRLRGLTLEVTLTRRSLQGVVAVGSDTTGASIWGYPGEGAMSHFPRMTRTFDALEATVEGGEASGEWFRVSYVLSRTRGNYPGLFASDWKLGVTNYGPMFAVPEQYVNGTGEPRPVP